MLIAQVVIGGAIAFATFAGILFALFTLRHDGSTAAMQQVSATILEAFESYLGRVYLTAFVIVLVLSIAGGAALGAYDRSIETGALVGGAAMVGALAAAIPGIVSAMLIARSSRAVAAAAQRGPRNAARAAVMSTGAAALISAGLMLLGAVGLFGAYTSLLEKPVEDAPQLMVAFAAGVGVVSLVVRASGSILGTATAAAVESLGRGPNGIPATDPRNPGVAAAMVGRAANTGGHVADWADSLALFGVSSLVIGAAVYHVTGEMALLLLPITLAAAGLASCVPAIAFGRFEADGRPTLLGMFVVVLLAAAAGAALSFGMVEDDWWWFAGPAGVGLIGGMLAFLVHRSAARALGEPGNPDARLAVLERIPVRATAAVLVVVAAAVLGSQALGQEGSARPVGEALGGIYGIVLAAAGFVMPGAYFAAVAGARPTAQSAAAMAAIAFDAPPETLPAAEMAREQGSRMTAGARSYGTAAALLVAIVGVLAVLQVVRLEVGAAAADDSSRYATMAQDLGLAPPGSDVQAGIAVSIDRYRQLIEDARVAVGDDDAFGDDALERLIIADRPETEGYLGRLLDDGDVAFNDIRDLETSPQPLPRVLPMSLARAEVIAGVLAGLAIAVLALGQLTGAVPTAAGKVADEVRRQFVETPGVRTGEIRADYARVGDIATRGAIRAPLMLILAAIAGPVLLGVGLSYAFGRDGNEGWLALASFGAGLALGATMLALWLPLRRVPEVAIRWEQETVAGTTEEGVFAARVTVGEAHREQGPGSFEAGIAGALPAVPKLAIAVALVIAPLAVG